VTAKGSACCCGGCRGQHPRSTDFVHDELHLARQRQAPRLADRPNGASEQPGQPPGPDATGVDHPPAGHHRDLLGNGHQVPCLRFGSTHRIQRGQQDRAQIVPVCQPRRLHHGSPPPAAVDGDDVVGLGGLRSVRSLQPGGRGAHRHSAMSGSGSITSARAAAALAGRNA
jgi:hypothetical protein